MQNERIKEFFPDNKNHYPQPDSHSYEMDEEDGAYNMIQFVNSTVDDRHVASNMSGTASQFSHMPFTVNMVSDKVHKERKSKLDTIGTLLEKAVI